MSVSGQSTRFLNEALGLGLGDDGSTQVDLYSQGHESALTSLLSGVLRCLAMIQGNVPRLSKFQLTLVLLIELMQFLSLVFRDEAGFPWNSWVQVNVSPVLKATTLELWIDSSQEKASIIFWSAVAVVSLCFTTLITCSFYVAAYVKKTDLTGIGYMSKALFLLKGPLFIPLLVALLHPCPEQSLAHSCSGSSSARAIGGVVALIHTYVGIVSSLLLFNISSIDSEDKCAKAHGRNDAVSVALKAVNVAVVLLLDPRYIGVAFACLFLSSIVVAYLQLYHLPFFDIGANRLTLGVNMIAFWATCLLLFEEVYKREISLESTFFIVEEGTELTEAYQNSSASVVNFFLLCPIVFAASTVFLRRRVLSLQSKNVTAVENGVALELVFRLKYLEDKKNWDTISTHYREVTQDQISRSSFFFLHLAYLMAERGENPLMARQYLRRALQQDAQVDERFMAFCYNYKQSKESGFEEVAMDYATIEHHRSEAERRILDSVQFSMKFFNHIISSRANMETLCKQASTFRKMIRKTNRNVESLVQLTRGSSESLRLYACFLDHVLQDTETAKMLYHRADMDDDGRLDFDMNASVTIDGLEEHLGTILDLTEGVVRMFGYSKEELLGQNISILCPPPFDKMHDLFLLRYLETNKDFVPAERTVWGMHSDGFVLPLTLHILPTLNANGELVFSGSFTRNRQHPKLFLMIDESENVVFASKDAWSILLCQEPSSSSVCSSIWEFLRDCEEHRNVVGALKETNTEQELDWRGQRFSVTSKSFSWNIKVKSETWASSLVLLCFSDPHDSENFQPEAVYYSTVGVDGAISEEDEENSIQNSSAKDARQQVVSNLVYPDGAGERRATIYKGRADQYETQSQVSSVTKGSLASNKSSMQKASVYHVVEDALKEEDLRLSKYKKVCFLSVFLCLVASLIEWKVRNSFYSRGREAVNQVRNSLKRSFLIVDIANDVNNLEYWASNSSTSERQAPIEALLDGISGKVENLLKLHTEVSSSSVNDFEGLKAMYDEKSIPVVRNDIAMDNGGKPPVEYMDMWNAVHLLAGRVSEFVKTIDLTQPCSTDCHFIVNNGINSIYDASIGAAMLYTDGSVQVLQAIKDFDTANFIIIGSVSILMVVFFMAPLLYVEHQDKFNLAEALLSFPDSTIKTLWEASKSKLRKLTNILSTDEFGEEEGPKSEQRDSLVNVLEPMANTSPSQGEQVQKQLSFSLSKKPGESSTSVVVSESGLPQRAAGSFLKVKKKLPHKKVQPEKNEREKLKKRAMEREEPRRQVILKTLGKAVFKYSWPYLLTIIYFGVVAMMENMLLAERIAMGRRVFYAGARWVAAHNLNGMICTGLNAKDIPEWSMYKNETEQKVMASLGRLDDFVKAHDKLLYGDPSIGVEPMQDASQSTVYEQLFVNACGESCKADQDVPVSRALQEGLHLGVKHIIHLYLSDINQGLQDLDAPEDSIVARLDMDFVVNHLSETNVLTGALEESVNFYIAEFDVILKNHAAFGLTILAIYMVSLVGSGWVTFKLLERLTRRREDLKYLFLLFPQSVLKSEEATVRIFYPTLYHLRRTSLAQHKT